MYYQGNSTIFADIPSFLCATVPGVFTVECSVESISTGTAISPGLWGLIGTPLYVYPGELAEEVSVYGPAFAVGPK